MCPCAGADFPVTTTSLSNSDYNRVGPGPQAPDLQQSTTLMEHVDRPFRMAAAVVCVALGLFAWTDFIQEITSGVLDFTNFEPILLPIGIALIQPGRGWLWLARIQLFILCCYSAILVIGSAVMTDQTQFLVFEFDRNTASASGVGLIILMHALYLAGILWVYFSIFGHPRAKDPVYELNTN